MQKSLIISSSGLVLAKRVCLADNFLTRCKGLLGKKSLDEGEALIIRPCNAVHMFFMRFSIDVVFCSADHKVLKILPHLRPWQMSRPVHLARYVIEIPAGTAETLNLKVGDEILEKNSA